MSHQEIIQAYRRLYKASLAAVQYSKPARYVVEDHLRAAFRKSHPSDFNAAAISNTLQFLEGAAKYRGLEHKILKNLMMTWWHQREEARLGAKKFRDVKRLAYAEHGRMVEALNESMGMCIK